MREKITSWVERAIRMPVIGLDISDRSIKYAKFARGRTAAFDFFGEVEIAEGIISDGVVLRDSDLVEVIRRILSQVGRGLHTIGAVVSLPEEKSFVRLLRLQGVKREDLEGAIRWQMEGQIPLPPEDIAYDYELIESFPSQSDHLDAVITAFPRGIVESYVRVIKDAGLQPVALELESQAIVRALIREASPTQAKIVIDMGRNRTSFIICAAGTIVFTATIPVGGRNLESEIVRALEVDAEEAVRIKKETGLSRDIYDGKLFSALLPLLENLANELGRAKAYYEDHIVHIHGADRDIKNVFLSGGDANLRGLDTYLASKMHIPVEIADPFGGGLEHPGYAVPQITRNKSLAFTAAIGLAMRGRA